MRRLVAVCAVLWVAGVCGGAVIRVAADGSGDYPTIQAAIDAAVNGDEIILGDGRYIGLGNREMDFLGKALKLRSENGAANCVIDCQAHYTNPRRALTFQSGEDANSVLEGLTFEDGYAFRENGYKGGAIKCTDHSSPRIADCIFFSNAAGFGQGGAIYAEYSSPTIVNCVFIENSADYGGAIFCSPDPVTIRNCVFTGNSAADYGGAIQAGTETLIECCEFTENTCDGPGGAIYGRGQVIRCSFSRNDAGSGGGVYASGWADMTIRQCVFSNNSAGVGGAVGAAAYSQAGRTGHTRLLNSLFTGNSARGVGGAVSTGKDTIATMINCTITENVSGAQGSGIWCDDNPNLTVTNSVVWGNKDISGAVNTAQISNTAAYNVTRCCIGGLKPDEQWAGKFSWDPLFVNADVGDYHLAVDSPCIDAGTNSPWGSLPQVDIEGSPRIIDGDNDGLAKADIGAYEAATIDELVIYAAPPAFTFLASNTETSPEPQILRISDRGRRGLTWKIGCNRGWLAVSPLAGSSIGEAKEVTLQVDSRGLGFGEYSCVIEVSDSNAVNSPKSVGVRLEVRRPEIAISQEEFDFIWHLNGAQVESQRLLISNEGAGTLNWNVSSECNWVILQPHSGECAEGVSVVEISVDGSAKPGGTYECELLIADPNAPDVKKVLVRMHVPYRISVPGDYGSIQSAIDAVTDGSIVTVGDGVYTGEGNGNITFRGKAITVRSENGPENCIIDCNSVLYETQWRGFVFDSGEDSNSVLDGFTITRGIDIDGGGIFCWNASPTIANCILKDNSGERGGGIFCGGYYNAPSRPLIIDCLITDNDTFAGLSAGWGGGVYCGENSAPRIERCTIVGNTARGLYREDGYGGGIYCEQSSDVLIKQCTISMNRAQIGGGVCLSYGQSFGASVQMVNCELVGNEASSRGGGLYAYRSAGEIRSSVIACNKSRRGGGAWIDEGNLRVNNCTIGYNCASEIGGGLYLHNSPLLMASSILWGNSESSGTPWSDQAYSDLFGPNGFDTGFCCVQDDDPCDGEVPFGDANSFNIDDYPIFVREPNDGGDGWGDIPDTNDVDEGANDDYGDLHLQISSPCIDAGNPHAWVAAGSIDIDGDARVTGRAIEIGADEYSPVTLVTHPSDGEVWVMGSLQQIRWVSAGVETVDIMFSRDGGSTWSKVGSADASDGAYWWKVANGEESEQCLLKVMPVPRDADVLVRESGVFSIRHDYSPQDKVKSEWPTLGGGVDRAGSSDVRGPLTGCVKWRFDMDGAVISSVTAGYKDCVHIACENGVLYTLDKDGELLWEVDVNSPLTSAPTVGPGGSVYVGAENGRVYAIDRKGAIRWTFDTGGPVYSAPAVGDDGKVYVCSTDGSMRAVDEDGTELWRVQTTTLDGMDGGIMASPAIGADGTIYVGGVYDANLYAVNPDGSMKWVCSFARDVSDVALGATRISGWPVASAVVGADGTIYQTLVYDPNLYAINAENGSIKWASRVKPYCMWVEHGWKPPHLDNRCDDWYGIAPDDWYYFIHSTGFSEPAMGPDGTVYVSFDDPYLRAVDPNGTIKWVTQLGAGAGFDLAVDSDGYIYAACGDGQLYVVSPDGTPMSMFEADEWLGYPVIAEDGTVIVSGSRDNTMLKEAAVNSVWALSRDACVGGAMDLDLIADLNGDGVVDSADLLLIADDWIGKDKGKRADKGEAVEEREERPAVERQMKGTR